jgi:hypothetical protein
MNNGGDLVKYTRNEWRRCQNALETSGEDARTHSKRVEKIEQVVVAQIAPAFFVAISEEFGLEPGAITNKQLVHGFI